MYKWCVTFLKECALLCFFFGRTRAIRSQTELLLNLNSNKYKICVGLQSPSCRALKCCISSIAWKLASCKLFACDGMLLGKFCWLVSTFSWTRAVLFLYLVSCLILSFARVCFRSIARMKAVNNSLKRSGSILNNTRHWPQSQLVLFYDGSVLQDWSKRIKICRGVSLPISDKPFHVFSSSRQHFEHSDLCESNEFVRC